MSPSRHGEPHHVEFRRGRGITVAGTPQRGAVLARTRELIEFATADTNAIGCHDPLSDVCTLSPQVGHHIGHLCCIF